MKRNNKKGFTIVELVIVIAVIAILSAVMIPTFSGIVDKANESARDQEAANLYKVYLIDHDYKTTPLDTLTGVVVVDGYEYTVTAGQLVTEGNQSIPATASASHLICNGSACTTCNPADGE